MTSQQSDEKTENHSAEELEILNTMLNLDDRLDHLSCPYSWDIGSRPLIDDEEVQSKRLEEALQLAVDTRDYFPEFELIHHLMLGFRARAGEELPSATECMKFINKAEQSLAEIKEKAMLKNVEKALEHIVLGSKCHVLEELGRLTEADELLETIYDIDDMNETELAMLHGCHCLAALIFHQSSRGIECAKAAIKHDPSNGKWHYLLGRHHRNARKSKQFCSNQGLEEEEIPAFQEAYRLSENVLFGVSLAQSYRESQNFTLANEIYKKVHALQPTCCTVRFQLALGFIRAQECVLAKECLDYIAEKMPDSTIYTHYMGIYEEKCNKNYKAAVSYYRRTTENMNAAAEWQYMECRKKVEPDWDPLPYLLDLLKKYETRINYKRQEINIQIGFYYLFETHDLLSACPYLTKAIEILPDAQRLRNYSPLFRRFMRVNVYHVLAKEVQFALEVVAAVYDDDKITILKNALELCRKNCLDLPVPAVFSRPQDSRSHMSSSYRNDNRGSSSRAENNWREDRPSSSFRGYSRYENSTRRSDGSNSPRKPSGSFQQRDYTSWRSDKQADQNKTLKDVQNSASTDRVRGSGFRQTAISQSQNNNDGVN